MDDTQAAVNNNNLSAGEMVETKKLIKKSDEMTEDEVAVMVRKALQKARRAMYTSPSSPLNDEPSASTSDEWSEPDFSASKNSKNNEKGEVVETTGENNRGAFDEDDELAKRIEAEINSARAFAEQAYFGKVDNEAKEEPQEQPPLSPHCAGSVKSDATEVHNNKTSSGGHSVKSPTSPLGYGVSPRNRRKAARKASSSNQPVSSSTRQENAAIPDPGLDISIPPMEAEAVPTVSPRESNLSPRSRRKAQLAKQQQQTAAQSSPRRDKKGIDAQVLEMDVVIPSVETPAKKGDAASADAAALYTSPDQAEKIKYKQEAEAMLNQKINFKPSAPPPAPPVDTSKSPILSSNPNILNSKVNTTSTKSNPTKQQQPNSSRQVIFRHPYPLPPPPVAPRADEIIINENAVPEKSFNMKIVEPDAELEQLIQQTQDEHNLVRRSNACGAIKVLASHDTNKAKLARTKGVLDALVYASLDDAVDSDALDARTRAVTALLYLSEPKDNRTIVVKHPGVVDVLVKVIEEDTGEARLRACSALATLAKTPQNRTVICNNEKLATVLSNLMVQNVTKKDDTAQPENEEVVDSKSGSQDEGTATEEGTFTQTFSGTFSEGSRSGTFTEDDTYHTNSYGMSRDDRSTYSHDRSMSSGDVSRGSRDEASLGNGSTNENASMGEEEGVEMQISSLKKLNIENASGFLERSQLSACATLSHLTKHCANAPVLCNNEKVLDNILFLAGIFENPLHTRCLEMLCNFTRFPSNNARLASMPKVIEILTAGGKSKLAEDRLWSIRTIQNLCSDASSKVGLATGSLLSLLSACAMRKEYEEQLAAVGALMNLATEPGSIVPLTNTKTVVATLVHLAHSPNTQASVRKIACDSLATIGLWLQTLASAGAVPEDIPFSPLPTHTATGWLRWD